MCSYVLNRIICSSYIYQVTTHSDSHHFNSHVERCHFEDVAGIAGNRCMYRMWQLFDGHKQVNNCGRFFKTRLYAKYLPFSDVASNKCHIRNGQFKFGEDPMKPYRTEIFACERRQARSAGNRIVPGEVWNMTTASLATSMYST